MGQLETLEFQVKLAKRANKVKMVSLVGLDRLERLVKMDYQEKLDGPANEGIEVQKDNR